MRAIGLRRLFLHAHQVSFRWPGEAAESVIQAPLPKALEAVVDKLKTKDEV
jgi:hypothetical protein